ncbi:MAG: synthase subunit b [Chthonomonadaceae bacterium]|nr:synthase subunit b [Chthonomonadaceae bacterium]
MDAIIKSLGFNVTIFFAQVVLFLLLWFVLGNIFFKPILGRLKQRDKDIADTYHTVQEMQHEMESLRADYLVRIAEVEAEARGRIQTAIKEAQSERERILAEARVQSEQTLHQGILDMEREKSEALVSLRGSMVNMAVTALQKTLGAAADPTVLRASIESSIAANPARN